ncbi:unnamed protein product [Paramecium octaurelia]|uniref:Trichocyst matrix protein n=1 Tax=Paramecium octaurelia TaxID=43137 RepID=A0A8S1SRI1_PAROT|nr:unnamed protein product [Paramecium octaurelia]
MKTLLLFIVFIGIRAVRRKDDEQFQANQEILHNDPSFDDLEEIVENPLGAKVLQTVALQIKSGEGIDSIVSLLTNLKSDLEGKQIQQDGSNAAIQSQCKSDMDSYSQRIQLAVNEINDVEFKVGRLESDIEDYTSELDLKQSQIDTFQGAENSLRDLRLKQSANYNKRLGQLKEMINAFQVMLPKMHELYDKVQQSDAESFVQEEAFANSFVQLANSGPSNPILALVQVTSMMDSRSIQTIIEKMEVVRDSLITSVDEETALEEQAIRDNDVTLNEIFNAMQALTREKAADDESLQDTIRTRDQQQKRGSDAQAEFVASKAGMKQRRGQCQELLVQYQQNTIQRSREIEIIKKVQIIIQTKLNVVKSFIQEQQIS